MPKKYCLRVLNYSAMLPELEANTEEEGGCGVTGFVCSIPVTGKNIFEPSAQMHNRGNGKGGGIGAVGFVPEALGVSRKVLDEDYMLHIALLDPAVAQEIENTHIKPYFKIDKFEKLRYHRGLQEYRSGSQTAGYHAVFRPGQD